MGRLGHVHAMSVRIHFYEPEAPLSELRVGVRPGVFEQEHAVAALRDHRTGEGL